MQRRRFNAAAGGFFIAATGIGCAHPAAAARRERFDAEMHRLEAAAAGRLGVCIRDTATGAEYAHRADERFPMTSTFKMLAAALVLARVDSGLEQLTRRVVVQSADIVPYAPRDAAARERRAHERGGALSRRRRGQRQRRGQHPVAQLRRAGRADGLCTQPRRSGDKAGPHRTRAQRGKAG
jgi:hypothetical protein